MDNTFHFYTDPGHGWLAVTEDDLKLVDLAPNAFTEYSYQKGNTLYLEEDGDAPVFIKAWEAKRGKMNYREHFAEKTPIRNYRRVGAA